MAKTISQQIADELGVREAQVEATIKLLDEGSTVPFIARYRKEVTGALDDAQLRTLDERLTYLREMEARRTTILNSIREQGKLDAALEAAIMAADSKGRLEDIYLPFKPKRRTKAEIAKEAGLEPLADLLLTQPANEPHAAAAPFVALDKQVADTTAALEGARSILVERFAEDADLIGALREEAWSSGVMTSKLRDGKQEAGAKFSDYFDFSEPLNKLPSHRILAAFRGEKEEILDLQILPEPPAPVPAAVSSYELRIRQRFSISDQGRPGDKWLAETVRWAWRTKILIHINIDLRMRLWTAAEEEAVRVFAANLRDLLLAAPAGARVTMGLDPGYRTGVKVAVVDATGKVVATTAIFPHEPQRRWDESLAILGKLAREHRVELIAIGNGTASRETDKLAGDLVKLLPELKMTRIVVSEAGASVYSASAFASEELPDLDVTLRGAVSIARRLQDPLAELVKIDPKSIGVGQYQHDVNQTLLKETLDNTVESCVNSVGVNLNTASKHLLSYVSGIGPALAQNIVDYRSENGAFLSRQDLLKVRRLGDKAFEQCAGFLRITGAANPLDNSAVHPERYGLVERIAHDMGVEVSQLISNEELCSKIDVNRYVSDVVGLLTLNDIVKELSKPGRDPRRIIKVFEFSDEIKTIEDLRVGMELPAIVTNITDFGAFVDLGIKQNGLIHVSKMSDRRISSPSEVLKIHQHIHVKVEGVDLNRQRISLSLVIEGK